MSHVTPPPWRDVKRLAELGYRTVRAQGVDLFPRTAHVETVAELVRSPITPLPFGTNALTFHKRRLHFSLVTGCQPQNFGIQ